VITRLLGYSSPEARRLLLVELGLIIAAAVLQGFAFLLLVPLLHALFEGNLDGAWQWLWWLAATCVFYIVAYWFSSRLAMRASTAVLDSLLAMTAMVPIMWFVYRRVRAAMERDDAVHIDAVHEASNRVIEFARVQPTLRTAGERSVADRLVEDALHHQHRAYRGLLITGGAGIAAFGGIVQLALTVIIALGAYLALGGSLDIATLIALLVLGVRFTEPIANSGALSGGVAIAKTTLQQLDDLMAIEGLPEPSAPLETNGFSIEFSDVTFGYGREIQTSEEDRASAVPADAQTDAQGDTQTDAQGSAQGEKLPAVLQGLSFTVPDRTMTAIVGPSGSGKTTITKLIARFYDPEQGTVSIGGVPLPQLGTAAVESAVAPVFQDVYLFDDSILQNIWIGNPELSREEVIAVASRARVDEIVGRLPGGWDARVGEGGSNLSGGERQRISIARALLKDAPIVLLDEATAALDIGNEIAIGEAIDSMRVDRTVVVVAHRLQTIMTADQIVMLDGAGGIRERGTHQQLIDADGAYAGYWRERVEATSWQLATATAGSSSAAQTTDPSGVQGPRDRA